MRELAGQFQAFLEGRHMNGLTKTDLKILQTTLAGGVVPKVEPFFDMVRKELDSQLLSGLRDYEFKVREKERWEKPSGHTIWDWCYFMPEPKLYLGWGLTGDAEDFFGASLRDSSDLLAFVYIGAMSEMAVPSERLPDGYKQSLRASQWKFLDGGALTKTQHAAELATKPEGFTQAFIKWTAESLREADEILQRGYATLGRTVLKRRSTSKLLRGRARQAQ